MDQQYEDADRPLILIVEDDESTGDVIKVVIEEETSYRPLWVTCAKDALDLLKTRHPHLFILDYRLPDMTGIELHDQLQAQREFKNIPTLLMSASKPVEEIEPRDVVLLSKPFELDDFLSTIHKLMNSYASL